MKYLYVVNNSLTGAIPPNLAMCTNLIAIELDYNRLTGRIPTELGKLRHLQEMTLGKNMLSGEIPWLSLTNNTSLYFLDLSYNHLSGGISSVWGQLVGLQYLYLDVNFLQGGIPGFVIDTALSLVDIDLSSNGLNGSLPSSLAHPLSTLAFSLSLAHNQFSGSLPIWLSQLAQAQIIDLSHNKFTGSIPESLGDYANLISFDLSNNHLSGSLPLQLGNASNLKSLDLSNNNFSGTIPSYLGTLHHLQSLNVSFNNLTGPIPTHNGIFSHLNASSFQGNPGLCGPILKIECVDLHELPKEHDGYHHHRRWPLRNWKEILLVAAFISLVLLSIAVVIVWRYCLRQHGKATGKQFIGKLAGAKRYSAEEIMEATQGYSEDNLLGQGGFSAVYKGVLRDGKIVAIKKMKDAENAAHEVLLREMQILRKVRHRNLVQVLGCVLNLDVKALVLEYMANGSLERYLEMHQEQTSVAHEEMDSWGLSYWEMMMRVAVGVAKALAYLHHEYDVPIIHGDVKPSNILFDSDMEPHLTDLGLAKLIDRGAEALSLTSDFKGTIGYMAPEYALAARITTKVDVYAYGVDLLRMITGRSPTQVTPTGLSLHEWVESKLHSNDDGIANIAQVREASLLDANIEEVLDTSLLQQISAFPNIENSTHNRRFVVSLLRMGLACTRDHRNDRPTIQEVLGFLTSTSRQISQQSHGNL